MARAAAGPDTPAREGEMRPDACPPSHVPRGSGEILQLSDDLSPKVPASPLSFPRQPGRMDHGWRVHPELTTAERPSDALKRLYYDSLTFEPELLATLAARVGADRILMGSDFPFDMGCEDPVAHVRATPGLSAAEQEAILGQTACEFLTQGTSRTSRVCCRPHAGVRLPGRAGPENRLGKQGRRVAVNRGGPLRREVPSRGQIRGALGTSPSHRSGARGGVLRHRGCRGGPEKPTGFRRGIRSAPGKLPNR
jgi:hypothetical protein